MKLSSFNNDDFDRGASRLKEIAWLIVSELLVATPIPGSGWRGLILKLFGATLGTGIILKPRIRVKFPWRLSIGDNSWVGEAVWIDNLGAVVIGHDVCISQGAYLCTGNHDWNSPSFDLIVQGIVISPYCWVGAHAKLAPGTTLKQGAVLSIGAVGKGTLEAWTVYSDAELQKTVSRSKQSI